MVKKILLLSLIGLLFVGCASKRFTKKGQQYEAAGYYEQAADMYYYAVTKKYNNVEAQIGLKTAGQMTLNKKLSDFQKLYNADEIKSAVYSYIEAVAYKDKLKKAGAALNLPTHYNDYYTEVKELYLEQKYQESIVLLSNEEFHRAEVVFSEILKIEPDYQDVATLKRTAHFEPIYRNAKIHLGNEQYRKAYYEFAKILKKEASYKDAVELKLEALNKAIITIAILEFENKTRYSNQSLIIKNSIRKKLTDSKSPFIRVIDRDKTNAIKDEQILTLEGKVDPTISAKAGKLLGAKTFLSGTLNSWVVTTSRLKASTKKAYYKERIVEMVEGQKKVRYVYHKTEYKEYEQSSSVRCNFSYQLLSAESGAIIVSDVFSNTQTHKVHYAVYDGKKDALVPGYWKEKNKDSVEDEVKDSYSEKNKLQRLLKSSKTLKSKEELKKELINKLAANVAKKIESYDPERN